MKTVKTMNQYSRWSLSLLVKEIYTFACNEMNIPTDDNLWFQIYELGEYTFGSTNIDRKNRTVFSIAINPNQTEDEFITTILHETRHYYQSIHHPDSLFADNYINGDANYDGYRNQGIEIAARAYANYAFKKYHKQLKQMIKHFKKNQRYYQ